MRKVIFFLLCLLPCLHTAAQPPTPDRLYGPLFRDVQLSGIFSDNKTFVDCLPKSRPDSIVALYQALRQRGRVDLRAFVQAHFIIPGTDTAATPATPPPDTSIVAHINRLWVLLQRTPATTAASPYSSLLPLPYPYIVPGGRFREIYYWDSYFTMLGLEESGHIDIMESMVRNFAFLIAQYGHIPNGNRTYFLSRSQPPFFSLMIDLLARHKGDSIYVSYLPSMEKEYAYFMDRSARTSHVVKMPDGSLLNRYYDQDNLPRQEAYKEDMALAASLHPAPANLFRDLRSSAESGWDFSSRWFRDGQRLRSIQTTQYIPVDLNCLLYHLEQTLAKAHALAGHARQAQSYQKLAAQRRNSIEKYCWSEQQGWYTDYDLSTGRPSPALSLAGMYPFFLQVAPASRLPAVQRLLRERFLQPGGVPATLQNTGQQWDYPNGWAPLHWVTIAGLENYGGSGLAREIATRWIALNVQVYRNTGKLMEKYNVADTSLTAGGGEYPTQDGFGWTNGVLLKLMRQYNK